MAENEVMEIGLDVAMVRNIIFAILKVMRLGIGNQYNCFRYAVKALRRTIFAILFYTH